MSISLRVVGIFYRTSVDLKTGSGTVKDVLEAAQSQITGGTSFNFSAVVRPDGMESPDTFRAFYESGFMSAASGIYYPEGEYVLSENLSGSPYTVWQYYILDKDGKFINRDAGFVPYDDPVNALVEDGQSVIWRLVSVLAGPTGVNPRIAKQLRAKKKADADA